MFIVYVALDTAESVMPVFVAIAFIVVVELTEIAELYKFPVVAVGVVPSVV